MSGIFSFAGKQSVTGRRFELVSLGAENT